MSQISDFDPAAFVRTAIGELRRALLDFSTRNKLLSFKHPDRGDFVRAVDELPAEMFRRLTGAGMQFKALPEQSSLDVLANATLIKEKRRRDPIARAREIGINPDFDLPQANVEPTGHHDDKYIQTLFFPDDLDRRVRKVYQAYQDHLQEKGVNVLNAAFGFLEWYEDDTSDKAHHAPLLLVPLTMERTTERGEVVYKMSAEATEAEVNVTLFEFLKQRYHLILPLFVSDEDQDAGDGKIADEAARLELWLEQISRLIANKRRWRVRRFVTVGTFPFSRIALFKDLATEGWDGSGLEQHELVSRLLGGRGGDDAISAQSANSDYPLDSQNFPTPVPTIVLEADSSQHSAIVDAMAGKSMVIQGPPGTGKSQTIANIIAAALDANKRILFLAEKSAALNVVSSRLKKQGLGPFLFEVHSDKTRKADVIASLAGRLKIGQLPSPSDLERKHGQRKHVRNRLARYVELMSQPVGQLGRSLQQLMWTVNRLRAEFDGVLPAGLEKAQIPHAPVIDALQLDQYRSQLDALATARDALAVSGHVHSDHPWRGVGTTSQFTAEEIIELSAHVRDVLQRLTTVLDSLHGEGTCPPDSEAGLLSWVQAASRIPNVKQEGRLLSLALTASQQLGALADYIVRYRDLGARLDGILLSKEETRAEDLTAWLDQCDGLGVAASLDVVADELTKASPAAREGKVALEILRDLAGFVQGPVPNTVDDARALVSATMLFCKASDEVLMARTEAMQSEGCERLVVGARQRAQTLKRREAALSARFDLARARRSLSGEHLYEASDALIGVNLVTQFGSNARQASKLWRSLTKDSGKADAKTKSGHLREVAEHLEESKSFAEDSRLRALFGTGFEGHNSNFDIYAAAASLLNAAATVMADASPAIQDAAQDGIINESVAKIRRLRSRFPHARIVVLEKWLASICETSATLDEVWAAAQERHRGLALALEFGTGIVHREAKLPTKRSTDGRWPVVVDLTDWRKRREALAKDSDLSLQFGGTGSGLMMEPERLRAALSEAKAIETCGIAPDLLETIRSSSDPAGLIEKIKTTAAQLENDVAKLGTAWASFCKIARVEAVEYFGGTQAVEKLALRERLARQTSASGNAGSLIDWMRYKKAYDAVLPCPAGMIATHFRDVRESQPRLADIFELCLARTLVRLQLDGAGADLADLSGTTLDDARARFAKLDKEIPSLDAERIACKLAERSIALGNDKGPKSGWTGLALIENETKKRKRHIPLRDLIRRAPQALTALKPVWMMSPLTVAQYLPRIENFFDLVVIDEASQMKPADAIGGLSRAQQAIIVGDPMQLPPTEFFGASLDDPDEQQGAAAGQSSILDLAEARLRQTRILRWHYRSRHENLIAFSNRYFYDSRLVVFPSAGLNGDLGVENVYVGGRYLGGGINPDEANAIVDRTRQLIERDPDRSIGLVTTNTSQRELVLELFEKLAGSNRKVADYRARWQETLEPFFVKNLENVQGDERDVIIISTVFGPGESGKVAQNFGPINSEAGHRRLNVLFTRAKQKIVLVTSLQSADILISPNSHRGVQVLKDFLEFSKTGRVEVGVETGHAPDSDFEIHVADRLRQAGYEPVPQIGVNKFRIDIGVRHPSWPNGFLAGIECDGATYHSGITVRDRDRLRQEILEGLGWRLYRIWSTDWFADQNREMAKLLDWLKDLRERQT